jgi:hypothetical protein
LGLITTVVVISGFVVSHRTSIAATTALADVEFWRLRARFANQEPFVDMSRRERSRVVPTPQASAPLHTLHIVVIDPKPIRLSLEQLEGRGAGLIADDHPGGGQSISWVD